MATQPSWLPIDKYFGLEGGSKEIGGTYYDAATNRAYTPVFNQVDYSRTGGENEQSQWVPGIGEYWSYDHISPEEAKRLGLKGRGGGMFGGGGSAIYNDRPYDIHDLEGNKTGSGVFKDLGLGLDNQIMSYLVGLAGTAGVGATVAGAGAAGAAGAGAGGGGGAIGSSAGALESGIVGAGAGGASGGGLGSAAGGSGLLGSIGNGISSAGSSIGSALGGGGTAGGLLSGGASWLGPAATLIGGALGSQGQKKEETSTRDIPEWLKPYVQKNLGYASGLLDKQMAPGYLQGYDDMRRVGQGLLNQPIAGNGFAKFFPGR